MEEKCGHPGCNKAATTKFLLYGKIILSCMECGGLYEQFRAAGLDASLVSDEAAGSAEYLRNVKTKLIEDLKATELDDGEELCLESEKLMLDWIDVWFENKIYDEGLDANSQ